MANVSNRKPRGKNVNPTLVYRAIRIPRHVLEHFEAHSLNASAAMRKVLTDYVDKIVDEASKQEVN